MIILVFTIFVVGRNLLHAVGIRREIGALERKRATYLQRIAEDSTLIERLQYDDYLEEYAREHYRMQRCDDRGTEAYGAPAGGAACRPEMSCRGVRRTGRRRMRGGSYSPSDRA